MLLAFDDNHSLLKIQRGDLSPLLQSTRDFLAMVSQADSSATSAPVVERTETAPAPTSDRAL